MAGNAAAPAAKFRKVRRASFMSEQPDDLPVSTNIDRVRSRNAREARHRHDLPAHRHHELGPGGKPHLAYIDDMIGRRALEVAIGGEAVLRLGNADRRLAVAHLLE